jgi:uncharacterized protein
VVKYHGPARRYLLPPHFLMRPLLNGGTLGGRERMLDVQVERLAVTTMEAHGCHTAILYGSRARGDATLQSDVDLLCVREAGPAVRDARIVDGLYLDAFIYPETMLRTLEPSLLRVLGGIVVCERGGFGSALLAQIEEFHDRGPTLLPDDERKALLVWSQKMLDRCRGQHGLEANYRRMFLLVRALEDYFLLRNAWFRGEKAALAWLHQHENATYELFERAAAPTASDASFTDLVRTVYGPHQAVSA